jgi:hypothetical protein
MLPYEVVLTASIIRATSSTTEAVSTSETSIIYQTKQHNIPEEIIVKSNIDLFTITHGLFIE